MNDFRWSPHMISWQKFLTFLDVHLTAPKSHFEQGIYVCNDITIFPTSIFPIWFVGRSSNIRVKNAMIGVRWKMFHFTYQILKFLILSIEAAVQRFSRKRCSEKMQHIYRRIPMLKCDFNKCNSMSKVFFPIGIFEEWNLNLSVIWNKSVNTDWSCFACFVLDIN